MVVLLVHGWFTFVPIIEIKILLHRIVKWLM